MGKKLLEAAAIGRWLKSLKSRRNSKQVHDEDKMHDESTQNDSEESYNDRRVGVYYGQLPDGKQIAVKRLCKQKFGSAIKFSAEIEKLGHLRHKNILHIQGYCSERNEKIIVYDYMPNACLLAHLHGGFSYDSHLSWNTRIMIARGCAEGLLYLHHHANPRVVHGNLKASNIVLNAKYEPLLSDYGLASIMNESSKAGQLSGYEAPERLHNALEKMCLTEKSDVFSFGIILLVLITGRRPYEKSELLKREYIVDWVEPLVLGGELEKLLDQRISHNFVQTELELLVHVAIICAQAKPENRPTMLEVVQLLHAAV